MDTHSSFPSWRIPWTEETGWLQSMEFQRVSDMAEMTQHSTVMEKTLMTSLQFSWQQNSNLGLPGYPVRLNFDFFLSLPLSFFHLLLSYDILVFNKISIYTKKSKLLVRWRNKNPCLPLEIGTPVIEYSMEIPQ